MVFHEELNDIGQMQNARYLSKLFGLIDSFSLTIEKWRKH